MGRSRGNFHSDEDPTQRSRRKKNTSSGDNLESASAGQGTGEGKRALYHCNYCNKDISGKIRIKCATCPDFDLCIECFSVGADVTPHRSSHPYRVMDNLSFPLICPDWNADDEILLLEGIEMYGLGNWAEVAEHVGTKNKEQCIEHYTNVYMNSPYFPLPDMSHVVGKNRKELLAMAKGHGEDKKGSSLLGDLTLKEETPFSPSRVKVEEMHKGGPSGRLLSSSNAEVESGVHSNATNIAATSAVKKASNMAQIKDGPNNIKVEDPQTERSYGVKKPHSSANEGPSLIELSGFNHKRQEFDPEYDNDAEQLLAEMEFKDTDTEDERELKLRVLRIYSKRLDERKRRKDFILERNLLYPNSFEKDLSPEEKALCRRYDIFMRFHSKEEHEELLQTVISEHRTLKRIHELKEARAAGCRTSAEADRYMEQKKKREAEESSRRVKESAQVGPSNQGGQNVFMASESIGKDSSSRLPGQASSSHVNDLDIMGFYETQLLSEAEKRLCCEIRLPPPLYLKMQEVMSVEIINGNVSTKSDAHHLFKIESSKIDRVYDMLVKKGLAQP
ncbi:Myb_DNA-binding domain-containing protein/ZZ domain-containing protein/SWIRM domain-containing protein [Cephalotus follicularis]|uniref:Transcriptional adapter n=1 Tax=Cephalotus follicularis TaxID=3775 RepID=A0A1Q3AVT0_CEPFO|nr:Myb_DNA-binding domain-containing protein/ZZ domain-containing protein/SWIRM domain-containing protein [Cephalotus follicularis]